MKLSLSNVCNTCLLCLQEICIGILGNMACVEAICAGGFGSSEQMYVNRSLFSVPRLVSNPPPPHFV